MTVSTSLFQFNDAGGGGGIYAWWQTVVISHTLIQNNFAGGSGYRGNRGGGIATLHEEPAGGGQDVMFRLPGGLKRRSRVVRAGAVPSEPEPA